MKLRVKVGSNIFLFGFIFLVLFINFDSRAKNKIKKEINIKDFPIYLEFEERTKCISKCPTIPPKSGFIESIVIPYERGECLRQCEQK
jgi:hypothetical protein